MPWIRSARIGNQVSIARVNSSRYWVLLNLIFPLRPTRLVLSFPLLPRYQSLYSSYSNKNCSFCFASVLVVHPFGRGSSNTLLYPGLFQCKSRGTYQIVFQCTTFIANRIEHHLQLATHVCTLKFGRADTSATKPPRYVAMIVEGTRIESSVIPVAKMIQYSTHDGQGRNTPAQVKLLFQTR